MLHQFTDADFEQTLKRSEKQWQERGEQNALKLFHDMSVRVPAYKKFLKANGVRPASVKTIADLSKLPIVTKENYLQAYPAEELFWDGTIDNIHQFSSSSGSTGEPFYWGVGEPFEYNTRWHVDFMLRYNFEATKKRTLIVNCYAMGTWIAGVLMNDILWDFARQGYPITLTSPGINKVEAVRAVQKLAPLHEQVIIIAYGPFAKDVIEESTLQGVNWKELNLGLWTGGEAYNESWREYMAEMLDIDRRRIVNKYASIDNGPMATETELTMGLRQQFMREPARGIQVYGQERQPSLVQYNPMTHYIEAVDGELVFTRNHGVPLVRYNIGDNGGIISFSAARDLYEKGGGKLSANQPQLPLAYVFGRSHHTATIYGLNLYPENVRAGAEDPRIRRHLSGKTMTVTGYSESMDQQLEITLELAPGADMPDADLAAAMQAVFVEKMAEQNSEYRELVGKIGRRAHPLLTFVPHGDAQFEVVSKQTKQAQTKAVK
jgi:phenylacetate-CoA ligase